MSERLKSWDMYASPLQLNFKGHDTQKTIPGAVISITAYVFILYICVAQGLKMVTFRSPTIKTFQQFYSTEQLSDKRYSFDDMSLKLMVGFTTGDGNGGIKSFIEDPRLGKISIEKYSWDFY